MINHPPPPSDNSNHSTPQTSPQQGSSNTFQRRNQTLTRSQVQIKNPHQKSTHSIQYIPAQSPISPNSNPVLTINTLQKNPVTNPTTSRTLSRPPQPLIQKHPLSYNLTSTNFDPKQPSNTTQNTTNTQSSSTQFHNHIPFTTIQTKPPLQQVPTQPQTNTLNILATSHNSHTTHATPSSNLPPTTLNTTTYINSSTSISKPIKSFDGLDHNYTPEEYLQHIEARVTFSLELQPTTAHEYKFWHARRMAFIQCSLTGTVLSWCIRLNL